MSAVISACGRYRYRLGREWAQEGPRDIGRCAFVMLNPSTADAEVDDPTIRRCINYAKAWGCVGLDVVNLFAWRATDPHDVLFNLADAAPEESSRHIMAVVRAAALVVCGWGNGIPGVDGRAATKERAATVLEMIRGEGKTPLRLGPLTKEGQPRHPLYLAGRLKPEPMP